LTKKKGVFRTRFHMLAIHREGDKRAKDLNETRGGGKEQRVLDPNWEKSGNIRTETPTGGVQMGGERECYSSLHTVAYLWTQRGAVICGSQIKREKRGAKMCRAKCSA